MRDSGIPEERIQAIVWDNPITFFSQSPNVDFSEIDRKASINQTQLFENNSVLRGQTPVADR
jgi:hypothetical protein